MVQCLLLCCVSLCNFAILQYCNVSPLQHLLAMSPPKTLSFHSDGATNSAAMCPPTMSLSHYVAIPQKNSACNISTHNIAKIWYKVSCHAAYPPDMLMFHNPAMSPLQHLPATSPPMKLPPHNICSHNISHHQNNSRLFNINLFLCCEMYVMSKHLLGL